MGLWQLQGFSLLKNKAFWSHFGGNPKTNPLSSQTSSTFEAVNPFLAYFCVQLIHSEKAAT